MAPAPRRAEVWLARLDKVRPVVVLTRDPLGRLLHSVIVVPVTSTVRGVSTEVALGTSEGLRDRSVAVLDNVQLLRRELLVQRIGSVAPATMAAICRALSIAVGCDAAP